MEEKEEAITAKDAEISRLQSEFEGSREMRFKVLIPTWSNMIADQDLFQTQSQHSHVAVVERLHPLTNFMKVIQKYDWMIGSPR